MSEKIGSTNLTIVHSTGSSTSGGTFTVTSSPSLKIKAEGLFIYKDTLLFSFSGGSSSDTLGGTGSFTPGTVYGTGSINPTSQKVKNENKFVIREKDTGSFTSLFGTFVVTSSGAIVPDTAILIMTDVEISDAGQIKVLAN